MAVLSCLLSLMTCFVWPKGCFDALYMHTCHVCIAHNSQRYGANSLDVLPHSVCYALTASHHVLHHFYMFLHVQPAYRTVGSDTTCRMCIAQRLGECMIAPCHTQFPFPRAACMSLLLVPGTLHTLAHMPCHI